MLSVGRAEESKGSPSQETDALSVRGTSCCVAAHKQPRSKGEQMTSKGGKQETKPEQENDPVGTEPKPKKKPDPTAVALRKVQSIIRQFRELGKTEQSFVILKLSELKEEAETVADLAIPPDV